MHGTWRVHVPRLIRLLLFENDNVLDGLALDVLPGLSGSHGFAIGRDHDAGRDGRFATDFALGLEGPAVYPLEGRGRVQRRSPVDWSVFPVEGRDAFSVCGLPCASAPSMVNFSPPPGAESSLTVAATFGVGPGV